MSKTSQFPLVSSTGTIVLVDDATQMIESMNLSLPEEWNIKSFVQAQDFLDYLRDQTGMLKQIDSFNHGAVDRFRKTGSVAIEVLRYWNNFPERYSIPQVVVVDYYMPKMNGIEVLNECKAWGGGRVLLTGMADEKTVMAAFNEERIDRYIPKQTPRLGTYITSVVTELLDRFALKQSQAWNPWFMSLSAEQLLILKSTELSVHLHDFVAGGYEHVAIGVPFGVLALGAGGDVKWLQIERTSSLDEAADLAIKAGASKDEGAAIRAGKAVSDARLIAALGSSEPVTVNPVGFHIKSPFDNDILMGTSFAVKAAGAPSPDMCFAAWLSRQPARD